MGSSAAIPVKQAVVSCCLELDSYCTSQIFGCTVKLRGLQKLKTPQTQMVSLVPNSSKLWL